MNTHEITLGGQTFKSKVLIFDRLRYVIPLIIRTSTKAGNMQFDDDTMNDMCKVISAVIEVEEVDFKKLPMTMDELFEGFFIAVEAAGFEKKRMDAAMNRIVARAKANGIGMISTQISSTEPDGLGNTSAST